MEALHDKYSDDDIKAPDRRNIEELVQSMSLTDDGRDPSFEVRDSSATTASMNSNPLDASVGKIEPAKKVCIAAESVRGLLSGSLCP